MTTLTLFVDAVIALTLLECIALAIWRPSMLRDVGINLVSGLCLMAALRCLVAGVGALGVAACLAAAGVAHAADLYLRWRRGPVADRSASGVLA